MSKKIELSDAETHVLQLLAWDNPVVDVATIRGTTSDTVHTQIRVLKGKLKTRTLTGAVAKAIKLKLIKS